MTLSFSLLEKGENRQESVTPVGSSYILNYPCGDNLVECTPYFSYFPAGNYIFEVWGAQGGFSGGMGGYSIGFITLPSRTPVYITIGAKGSEINRKKGFTTSAYNGGGVGYSDHVPSYTRSAGSGGGSTDIRLNQNTYWHRCIVAGGGGGKCEAYGYNVSPGYGGGIEGGASANGHGGTQENFQTVSGNYGLGSFGEGGSITIEDGTAGGGGGGWFGGSTGKQGSASGGAGGSGYALHKNSFKPLNYMLNNSIFFFKYWNLYNGQDRIPKCSGEISSQTEYETGHSGSGCARITVLSSLIFYTKKNSFLHIFPRYILFVNILFK